MKNFALYNYQFERIIEPDNELKFAFPNWKYVNPDESFEKKQELFGRCFPKDSKRKLPFEFWNGKKFHVHELVIPPTEDGIIILNLSNKKQKHRINEELKQEAYDDYPYVMVIIDNRPGVQRILIEQNQSVFKDPKTPAKILQKAFNKEMMQHMLSIELYAQYPVKEFWKEVDNHPEGFKKVIFHLPCLNLERLTKVTDRYFTQAREDWQSSLDFSFTAPKGGKVSIDPNNPRQKALAESMSLTGLPTSPDKKSIEMRTAGETSEKIWVGRDSYLIFQIPDGILAALTSGQLAMFADQNALAKLRDKLDTIKDEV